MYLPLKIHEEDKQRPQLGNVEQGAEDGQPSGEEGEVTGGDVHDAGEEDETSVDKVEAGGEQEEGNVKVHVLLLLGVF